MKDHHGWHGSEDYPRPVSAVPSNPDDDLEVMWDNHIPPWNAWDTFLRRALMGGGALLVWAVLIAALIFAIQAVIE